MRGGAAKARRKGKKTGVGCDGFHAKVPWDLTKETRRYCGVHGEGGAKWKMAAAGMYDDVLFDSEECYK